MVEPMERTQGNQGPSYTYERGLYTLSTSIKKQQVIFFKPQDFNFTLLSSYIPTSYCNSPLRLRTATFAQSLYAWANKTVKIPSAFVYFSVQRRCY